MMKVQFNAFVNLMALVFFLISAISGIALLSVPCGDGFGFRGGRISADGSFAAPIRQFWTDIHQIAGVSLTVLIVVHLLLHLEWFVKCLLRLVQGVQGRNVSRD
ncbi:MAG: DUF4405 domain-containing protein [Candidatus Bathyarchaeia archaeon]